MDKYTVDLDQVLNDFEYLELTDQHSHNNINNIDNRNLHYDNLGTQSTPNKHSINNVFSSLQEYLNSDISSATESLREQPQKLTFYNNDNLIADSNNTNDDNHIKDATINNIILPEKDQDPSPDEQPLLESVETENDNKTTAILINENTQNTNFIKTENVCSEECDNNENINCLITKDNKTGDNDVNKKEVNVEKELINDDVVTEAVDEIETNATETEINQMNNDNKIDVNNLEVPPPPPLQSNIEPIDSNNLVSYSCDMDMNDEELDQMLETLENEQWDSDIDDNDDNNQIAVDEESINKKNEEELNENKPTATSSMVDLKSKNIEIVDDDISEKKEEEKSTNQQRPQNLAINVNENLEVNSTVSTAGRKIDLIGSPGSTPYNNVYINESVIESTTNQHNNNDEDREKLVSSPTLSDTSTSTDSSAASYASTSSTASIYNSVPAASQNDDSVATDDADNIKKNQNNDDMIENKVTNDAGVTVELENNENTIAVTDSGDATEIITEETNGEGTGEAVSDDVAAVVSPPTASTSTFREQIWLGKEAPLWIPDSHANACLQCNMKFTVIKRRHHCRACGLVLCSKCCNMKFHLEYLKSEARVCNECYNQLNKNTSGNNDAVSNDNQSDADSSSNPSSSRPNPNNPLEYCSTISPFQQVAAEGRSGNPPSVMVPVGVLKRKGAGKKSNKSVMFCDGIAPGSDLTHLDQDFNYNQEQQQLHCSTSDENRKSSDSTKKSIERGSGDASTSSSSSSIAVPSSGAAATKLTKMSTRIDPETGCYIPKSVKMLPPIVTMVKTGVSYANQFEHEDTDIIKLLNNSSIIFAINQNLFVHVKIINMNCCINKTVWCFSTDGLINVGSDEFVYLIEFNENETTIPKDIFFHIHSIYLDAVKGNSIKELGLSLHSTSIFLNSKNHAGFVYIRPTFQCLENIIKPKEPYLIGILIHRWETPWAKLFPLRLVLRLGAEYRYYPSPIISTRYRDSVYVEIGHTIINLLADFRNFTYSLSQIRGLLIHMEDKNSTLIIPKNRYEQVIKTINNSSDSILAFAGNFSKKTDSHLVCIQDTQGHENCYTTHAINIHNKPRRITGASFIVFNGSLKSSSGLTAKSNIIEDGLMIQVPSEHMDRIRESLRNMKNHSIPCGCINTQSDEIINIVWSENDDDFNLGIKSPIDDVELKGIPSIRVHNAKDYYCNSRTRFIRWTEVFIMQNGADENAKNQEPVDISKVSESIAKACCQALVKYLDLLVTNSFQKIAIRTTLHVDNVSYWAGSNGIKLPPIYMRSLDNELIPVLHKISSNASMGNDTIVLELFFRILNA